MNIYCIQHNEEIITYCIIDELKIPMCQKCVDTFLKFIDVQEKDLQKIIDIKTRLPLDELIKF